MTQRTAMNGEIFSIVYQPVDEVDPSYLQRFHRKPLVEATLIADHGIEGDAKAGHNPTRQLNLLSFEWLESLPPLGNQIKPGDFGEQLILRGLMFEAMPPGTRLQLGASAVIEITKPRTGCIRLAQAQGRPLSALGVEVGLLARVITGGVIRSGDKVLVLPFQPTDV